MANSDENKPDAATDTKDEPAAEAQPAPTAVKRRGAGFRDQLLAKLPTLGYHSLTVAGALDVRADLGGIVDLDADAFLEPLQALVPDGKR
jgi:hypothetical protein